MKVTAYKVLVFYICLNVALFAIKTSGIMPQQAVEPRRTPEMMAEFLLGGFLTFAIATITTFILGNMLIGAAAGLILFAIQYLVGQDTVIHWIFYGFPAFIEDAAITTGADATTITMFTTITMALCSLPWFWFILSLFSQRSERA